MDWHSVELGLQPAAATFVLKYHGQPVTNPAALEEYEACACGAFNDLWRMLIEPLHDSFFPLMTHQLESCMMANWTIHRDDIARVLRLIDPASPRVTHWTARFLSVGAIGRRADEQFIREHLGFFVKDSAHLFMRPGLIPILIERMNRQAHFRVTPPVGYTDAQYADFQDEVRQKASLWRLSAKLNVS